MGHIIKIKGNFSGSDMRLLEEYIKSIVTSATGEQVSRVTQQGTVKQDLDQIRDSLSLGNK